MSKEKTSTEDQVREEETAVRETTEEEANTKETVPEEEETEEAIYEEAAQNEEHGEEVVQNEEHREDVAKEEHIEDAAWERAQTEDEIAGNASEKEGEIAEEIIYSEGEGIEEMGEQEYRTVEESKLDPEFLEEEPKKRGLFRRNKEEAHFLRDKWILSRIRDEDLMDYLVLEQKRNEQLQEARDIREKRIVSAFKLTVSLAAGVAVVYLLKDNPTIFVNILYIGGILGGFWFWKNPREK